MATQRTCCTHCVPSLCPFITSQTENPQRQILKFAAVKEEWKVITQWLTRALYVMIKNYSGGKFEFAQRNKNMQRSW